MCVDKTARNVMDKKCNGDSYCHAGRSAERVVDCNPTHAESTA